MIRLWKLGSLEHKYTPGQQAFSKLREILASARGDVFDIIWDSALDVEVHDLGGGDVRVTDIVAQDGSNEALLVEALARTRVLLEDPAGGRGDAADFLDRATEALSARTPA